MQIFVTGTEKNTGKTAITTGLATVMQSLDYKAGVYKPIQTGAIEKNGFWVSPDLAYIKNFNFYIETFCTYYLKHRTAPSIAAELEKTPICINAIQRDYSRMKEACEALIIEDTGGLAVPISETMTVGDIAKSLDVPILIVANADFESINNTLLTINHATSNNINVAGVIVNKYPNTGNSISSKSIPRLIEEYTDVDILGIIPYMNNFDNLKQSDLINIFINCVDVEKIFRIKIPKLNLV
jgi:dethiobiotin synthetase